MNESENLKDLSRCLILLELLKRGIDLTPEQIKDIEEMEQKYDAIR